jgi:pSer/pThr/pTyr-binding forkhead associated (FHA) protein/predicted Ser/Thr protein kinase
LDVMAGEQLCVTQGKERGTLLSVEADLLIGRRAPANEGRLGGDPEISRRHARVSRGADQQLKIEDLGSSNGTFVNHERIDAPRTLQVGDLISVGKTVLQVTAGSGAVPEKSRPPEEAAADEPPSASAEASDALVVMSAGSAQGRRLIVRDEIVIGRGVSGDGRLSDDSDLSRRHARVYRDASGQLIVEDLGSANGTFVNGEPAHGRYVLKVGDLVRVGPTTLQVTDVSAAQASSPPPAAPAAAVPPPVPAAAAAPAAAPPVSPAKRRKPPAVAAPPGGGLVPELPAGSVFAGCRVAEVIGRGDMGVVYRAEELALQRRVALKLILPEYSREERFRERFRRESRIAAAIDHQNVIPIFDAGDADGVLYIMMRFVEGTDMRALIAAEERLEPLRAARIVRQVGAALDAAHARAMLHRDVKPSNVLLGRHDHVYLTDFGLAKPTDSAGGLTRQGTVVARAEYVAPEQILNQRVDARADIYALGCLLFEALTGESPFASGKEAGPLAHLDAPPRSPLDLRSDLPPGFGDVVRRAMAKDPRERYPSAGDLGQAALVAAGGLRRAGPRSVVATGEAAPLPAEQVSPEPAVVPRAAVPQPGQPGGSDLHRWAIALAALLLVAVGMVGALHGISTL